MRLKRRLAAAVGQLLDISIIPNGGASGWPEDRFLAELLTRLQIDCVFDVGANIGQYGSYLRRLGYSGHILSFEPGPEAGDQLLAVAASDERWHVFRYALGSEESVLPFNIMRETAMSSFQQPATIAGQAFSDVNVIAQTIEVPVKTLSGCYESLSSRFGFQRPMLKMDTQGFDLQVIAGAEEVLHQFLVISSEVAIKLLYQNSPLMTESLNRFSVLGFDLIGLYSVHPGNLLDPHEFNCYVLRRDLASG